MDTATRVEKKRKMGQRPDDTYILEKYFCCTTYTLLFAGDRTIGYESNQGKVKAVLEGPTYGKKVFSNPMTIRKKFEPTSEREAKFKEIRDLVSEWKKIEQNEGKKTEKKSLIARIQQETNNFK